MPRKPYDSENRNSYREHETPVAQRTGGLEIFQVDSLGELFGCARSWHRQSSPSIAAPLLHGLHRAESMRVKEGYAAAAIRAATYGVASAMLTDAPPHKYSQNRQWPCEAREAPVFSIAQTHFELVLDRPAHARASWDFRETASGPAQKNYAMGRLH